MDRNETRQICQCCGMPLTEDLLGKNEDGTTNAEYCKWCLVDGLYTYTDPKDLIEVCVPHLVTQGFTEEQARTYMHGMLPRLGYWRDRY